MLNHILLSYRLREIGIHGQVHNWLMSLLSNRISSVKITSSLSAPFDHTNGVTRGSVLGPILIILYILIINFFLNTHIFVITSFLMTYKFIHFFYLVLILTKFNFQLLTVLMI